MFLLNKKKKKKQKKIKWKGHLQYKMFLLNNCILYKIVIDINIYNTKCSY